MPIRSWHDLCKNIQVTMRKIFGVSTSLITQVSSVKGKILAFRQGNGAMAVGKSVRHGVLNGSAGSG